MTRSAASSTGPSIVAPVITPALKSAWSLTMPRALYVVRIGTLVRRPSSASARAISRADRASVGPRADAGDDDRAPRLAEELTHVSEIASGRSHERGGQGARGRRRIEVDVNGTRPGAEDAGDDRTGQLVGLATERNRRERHRCHHRQLIDALVRDAVTLGRGDAVGDQHHWLAVEQRLRDAVDGTCHARTTRDHTRPRRTGQLTDDTRHDGRCRFGMGEHEAHAALVHRSDDVEVRTTAWHTEHQ